MEKPLKKVIIDGQLCFAVDSKSLYKNKDKTKRKVLWFFSKKKNNSK